MTDTQGFKGGRDYSKPKASGNAYPLRYKVKNQKPGAPSKDFKPGITATKSTRLSDGNYEREDTLIEGQIEAVILFVSDGRSLRVPPRFQVSCSSHDGVHPSLRIQKPLCRETTAEDLAKVFTQWRGYDKAKVEGAVEKHTAGTGKLQVCAIQKSDGGTIALCPFAKKDAVGRPPPCKQHLYVRGYDVTNARDFEMELTGGSMAYNDRFVAPIHEFFRFIQSEDKACYEYSVKLSAREVDGRFLLGVSEYKLLEEKQEEFKSRATDARDRYRKQAFSDGKKKEASAERPKVEAKVEQVKVQEDVFEDDDDVSF
jgi:hypothetical protein